ncbi:hypothetical protein [Litoribacter populi]|uniref:hypothetical protein n=1 Tax=Litoribacter populi TaxID=2598460 RepID=UPI00117D5606|nr:hypothetical protein [Litoribacter populi]
MDKISTLAGIAQNLAEAKVFYGETNYINEELQHYHNVTRGDLKRVANEYLTMDGRVVLHYLPQSAE